MESVKCSEAATASNILSMSTCTQQGRSESNTQKCICVQYMHCFSITRRQSEWFHLKYFWFSVVHTYIYFIDLGCRMASASFTQCQTPSSVFTLRLSLRSAKPSILNTVRRSLLLPLFSLVQRNRNRGCNKKIYTLLNINNLYEQTWNRVAVNRPDNTFDRVYETTVLEHIKNKIWWNLRHLSVKLQITTILFKW